VVVSEIKDVAKEVDGYAAITVARVGEKHGGGD